MKVLFSIGISDDLELGTETYEIPRLGDEVGIIEDGLIEFEDGAYGLVDLKGKGYRIDDLIKIDDNEYHGKLNWIDPEITLLKFEGHIGLKGNISDQEAHQIIQELWETLAFNTEYGVSLIQKF